MTNAHSVEFSLVECPTCKRPAVLVTSGPWGPFYECKPCDMSVGCHRGTTRPKGRLANAATRALRIAAHEEFDKLWKREHMTRIDAYAWLGGLLALKKDDCHIGMMSDEHLRKTAHVCADKLQQFQMSKPK